MNAAGIAGLPWSTILPVVLLVVVVLVALARVRSSRQGKQRDEAERLAREADAEHEGARTRHEGGA